MKLRLAFNGLNENESSEMSSFSSLEDLLLSPDSKLTVLDLSKSNIGDVGVSALARGVSRNNTLRDLKLDCNTNISEGGWREIFDVFTSPNNLEKLSLSEANLTDASVIYLGSALATNRHLKALDLSWNILISPLGWQGLLEFLQHQHCVLEDLDLSHNHGTFDNIGGFNDDVLHCLTDTLANNWTLKSLKLTDNYSISTVEWEGFFNNLRSPQTTLETLNISGCRLNDEVITSLTNVMITNCKLRELSLVKHRGVTSTGWGNFADVFESPHTALEKLNISSFGIVTAEANLITFANALASNNKLKELSLYCPNSTSDSWNAISQMLCNRTSKMATFQSNHTLEKLHLSYHSPLPNDIKSFLQINQENAIAQSRRLKIAKVHFSGGFAVEPFIGIERNILPNAIAWIGGGARLSEFYDFVLSMPSYFEVAVRQDTNVTGE